MVIEILIGLIAVIDIAVATKIIWAFSKLRFPVLSDKMETDLPTVSVCIAARNETHAMTQCLERVVASGYPKLEIIVLDDGSRDDTSVLIKSFAHSGVRFIEGKKLPNGWLGKNYAQSILASEASGKYVFYIDVDTHIKRHTITKIVTYALKKNVKMLSIIPMRDDSWRTSLLFATMRHFWTVFRFNPKKPPAVANAWFIERDALLDCFKNDTSLASSMQVETTIARHLSGDGKFRLLVSDSTIGLSYEKRWSSQVETSIRLLYPQREKRIVKVALTSGLLLIGLMPYVIVFFSLYAILPILLQFIIGLVYFSHMWGRYRVVGSLLVPYTIAQELLLLIISTFKYRYGKITWKGRPITNN